MGTYFSTACGVLDPTMTMRIDVSQTRIPLTRGESHTFPVPTEISNAREHMQVMHSYDDFENDCVIIDSPSAWARARARASWHVHTTNGNTEKQEETRMHNHGLEKVYKERLDVLDCRLEGMQKDLANSQREVQNLQSDVYRKEVLIEKLRAHQAAETAELHTTKAKVEEKLRCSQNATAVGAKEVQRLKADIEEKDKILVDLKTERCLLITKCQKLDSQLATIEQKSAQESLTSGSYADDHANPGMLEVVCKGVDKAIESLAKFLHDNSIASSCPLDSEYLKDFVCRISPAHAAEFSRAIQVRHAWGHWICLTMFRCFEHVYFNIDDMGLLSSPLDFKNHALLCFQKFQHMKGISPLDLYRECHPFQAFCAMKWGNMFPPWLLELALNPNPPGYMVFGDFLQFNGNEQIWNLFLEVAKAVWLLHHLSFSFNPPATILRMAKGTPYDKQFHDSVISDENRDAMSQIVVLMTRPAFRLRNSIIRSQVFLSKKP